MKLTIQRTLIIFGIVVSIGLMSSIALKKYIFEELKVHGVVYHEIENGKNLVADILPPPLYVVQSYMLANEMVVHPTLVEKTLQQSKHSRLSLRNAGPTGNSRISRNRFTTNLKAMCWYRQTLFGQS